MQVQKGDWVQIYDIILTPEDRAAQVPEDTSNVPLEMRVNGFVQSDSVEGDTVTVTTLAGRKVTGKLIKGFPTYELSYGSHIPEVAQISLRVKKFL